MNLIEVVITLPTALKEQTFRFPVNHNIRINLANLSYIYAPLPKMIQVDSGLDFPSVPIMDSPDMPIMGMPIMIEFYYDDRFAPGFPLDAMANPGERVKLNLTLEIPEITTEPIGTLVPFVPLITQTGFAYYGTFIVLPNTNKTFANETAALRLPINRRTGIDLDAQIDASGDYISPTEESETLTAIILEQAEINLIKEEVTISIINPTDIVHYYESTRSYVVSNIFEFTSPVKYITPYNKANYNENNVLLPIPLTGGEFDVNFITKTVTARTTRLYTEPPLNTSIGIITYSDGSVTPMLAENLAIYAYVPSAKNLFFVLGYDYFTPLEDVPEEDIVLNPQEPTNTGEYEVRQYNLANPQPEIIGEPTPTTPNVSISIPTNIIPEQPLPKELRINTVSDCVGIGEPSMLDVVWDDYTVRTVSYQNCPPVTTYYEGSYPFANYDNLPSKPLPSDENVTPTAQNNLWSDTQLSGRDPTRTPLPTERTNTVPPVVDDTILPPVTKPKSIVDEKWFPVVIVVPLVVVIAVIVGILMYRHRSAKAKSTYSTMNRNRNNLFN